MSRSKPFVCALLAFSLAGCGYVHCGPGTKERQQANGDAVCVPVDEPAADIACDQDAGDVVIVDGKCASRIQCDSQTAQLLPSGLCVGVTGSAPACPPCPKPAANGVCVSGNVFEFATGMQVMAGGRPLRISVYDPLSFLGNPQVAPIAETTTSSGCFALPFAPPGQLIAVVVSDPAAGPGSLPPLTRAAVGAAVANGQVYKIDAFAVENALVDQWSSAGGSNFANGAYVACYYDDPVPAPNALSFTETMPQSGVQPLFDGAPSADARYLDAQRHVDTTLTSTSPLGCAVLPTSGGVHGTGGTGGGVAKWESRFGGSAAGVVFLDRFHSCDLSPSAASCM